MRWLFVLIFFYVESCDTHTGNTAGVSLYGDNDFVVNLDAENFIPVVRNSSNAWFLEFYASWCGHCQRFAPIWKSIANDIKGWQSVVRLGAVNCASSMNTPLCRQFKVEYYPTLRVVDPGSTEDDIGINIKRHHGATINDYRQFLVDYVTILSSGNGTTDWPQLDHFKNKSLNDLVASVKQDSAEGKHVALIAENEGSYLGREVILDMSSKSYITIYRVTSNRLLQPLNLSQLPALLIFREGSFQPLDNITSTRESYVKELLTLLHIPVTVAPPEPTPIDEAEALSCHAVSQAVYMRDLENGIWYAISNEVAGTDTIVNETRHSLDRFLDVLVKYFPAEPPLMALLQDLQSQLSNQTGDVNGTEFGKMVEEAVSKSNFTGKMRDWLGCAGSEARYRGYPCSLWSLFHTLTISHLTSNSTDAFEVLDAILGYVTHFFGCRHCSEHFQSMAAVDMKSSVQTMNDSVIWLWRAHNKVNARLSGDVTEDPGHPKLQFPSQITCSSCWKVVPDGLDWSVPQALEYLVSFYSADTINLEGLP